MALSALPDDCIHVVIEIPRGSRNKYEIDHETGRVYLDRRLFTATTYPADYGYIPETLGGDGDALDALVLLEDAVYPGVWVAARPVGVLYMRDEAGEDAKILCVPPKEPRWNDVHDLVDLTPQLVSEIQHFFEVYKALEPGKESSSAGIAGRDEAWTEIHCTGHLSSVTGARASALWNVPTFPASSRNSRVILSLGSSGR